MKVLMTADAVGGVWTYALDLAAALVPHDVEVVLAVTGPRPNLEQRRAAKAAPLAGYHERACRLEWQDDPWVDLARAGDWLLGIEERERVQLVHLNGLTAAALPWRAPVLSVAHGDVLSWHEAVRRRPAGPEWARYAAAVRKGLAAADAVVAPTAAVLDEVALRYAPRGELHAIPNGRDAGGFWPLRKQRLVAGAGRVWDEAKNLLALDRVAGGLPEGWQVRIAGDATGVAEPSPRLLGRLGAGRLATLLGTAAVFAAPARYEPFGLGAVEAGHAGCALVLGDIASLRETWDGAAAFVDPFDDRALLAALRRLARDDAARTRLALAARERARSLGTRPMAARYAGLYARLVAARPALLAPPAAADAAAARIASALAVRALRPDGAL